MSSDAFGVTAVGQISNQRYPLRRSAQQQQGIMSGAAGAFSFGMLLPEFYGEMPAAISNSSRVSL